jgi:PTS system mannose-specific IIC component
MESVLDQFQLHQPIISCTLIGIFTFDPERMVQCIVLGGTMQMVVLGWMNIGAAVSPDAAAAGIGTGILVAGGMAVPTAIPLLVPFSIIGLILTILVRTINTAVVHNADKAAEEGSYRKAELTHYIALALQGLRITIVAAIVLAVGPAAQNAMNFITTTDAGKIVAAGLQIGGGMIVVVGYGMVINMMATKTVWPFFFAGFAMAAIFADLNLIACGIIGVVLALVYLELSPKYNGGSGQVSGGQDNVDQILNNF